MSTVTEVPYFTIMAVHVEGDLANCWVSTIGGLCSDPLGISVARILPVMSVPMVASISVIYPGDFCCVALMVGVRVTEVRQRIIKKVSSVNL